jgi:uncharacterized protein YggE
MPRTITVVGVGKVSLKPDMSTVSIRVDTMGSTLSEARAEVDVRMAKELATLVDRRRRPQP